MKFKNKANLPEWVVRGLTMDNYARGAPPFDISATGLNDSSMIRHLMKKHGGEVEKEALDMLPSAMGTAIHSIFEDANVNNADVVCEKRLYFEVDGYNISAQYDIYEGRLAKITDIKTTSVWSIIFDKGSQWEAQLNIQAYAAKQNGMEVESLEVCAILKDWQRSKQWDDGYPRHPIVMIPIRLWEEHETLDYIRERLKVHFDQEPTCTDQERWKKPDKWAVNKEGRKSAVRVLDSEEEAEQYMEENGLNNDAHHITHRVGGYVRCADYCTVSNFCSLNPKPF